jgi:hypothetical protein
VATITISLSDEQAARLTAAAAGDGRSLDEVVRDAVEAYLAHAAGAESSGANGRTTARRGTWRPPEKRMATDGMLVSIPPAMSTDEVTALLAASSPAARREYLKDWLRNRGARTVTPERPADTQTRSEALDALDRIHAHTPLDVTVDEIEHLVTEVSDEARRERIARRELIGE